MKYREVRMFNGCAVYNFGLLNSCVWLSLWNSTSKASLARRLSRRFRFHNTFTHFVFA
jgi:hypothetical protein